MLFVNKITVQDGKGPVQGLWATKGGLIMNKSRLYARGLSRNTCILFLHSIFFYMCDNHFHMATSFDQTTQKWLVDRVSSQPGVNSD